MVLRDNLKSNIIISNGMEYEEENISQEELEENEKTGKEADDESEELIEDLQQDEPKEKAMANDSNRPTTASNGVPPRAVKSAGLMLTVFGAILLILIGGLAAYYYTTFQKSGQSNERVLTNVWDETVLATINLTNKFEQIDSFVMLGDTGKDNFDTYVSDANRAVRDGIFDVRSQTGLDPTAGTFASKLNGFLDDYSNMLGELKRVASRVEEIDDANELKELIGYGDDMQDSYDDLILAGNSFIQANLPRTIFEMPDDVLKFLEAKLESDGTLEAQDKENRQAAETVATKFVQAWKDRDPDGMSAHMTAGAKVSFNKGILEDSSDIISFRIMNTKMDSDATIEISGKIDKETPDGQAVSEDWNFTLIKTGEKWLVDTWEQA
jgi:hypothetical protein